VDNSNLIYGCEAEVHVNSILTQHCRPLHSSVCIGKGDITLYFADSDIENNFKESLKPDADCFNWRSIRDSVGWILTEEEKEKAKIASRLGPRFFDNIWLCKKLENKRDGLTWDTGNHFAEVSRTNKNGEDYTSSLAGKEAEICPYWCISFDNSQRQMCIHMIVPTIKMKLLLERYKKPENYRSGNNERTSGYLIPLNEGIPF
jgi:hypothetical protein